ncbi:manganese resistance protein [Stylonychia lemnae]|uniref:Manganese resistance protein n=1 Tax=Stylonychia lemnae TaxID=5949 RepID=A0A077ZZL4_STYLE|nr:manganese resistance protein [Stylonychia lemnae]|eukprot:CDW75366.1 manganese resistance protein [Stylonychia lemnae]
MEKADISMFENSQKILLESERRLLIGNEDQQDTIEGDQEQATDGNILSNMAQKGSTQNIDGQSPAFADEASESISSPKIYDERKRTADFNRNKVLPLPISEIRKDLRQKFYNSEQNKSFSLEHNKQKVQSDLSPKYIGNPKIVVQDQSFKVTQELIFEQSRIQETSSENEDDDDIDDNLNSYEIQPVQNDDLTELVKSIKRARLDSLLGVGSNFLNYLIEGNSSESISKKKKNPEGSYHIFDLGYKQYRDCTLSDVINFKKKLLMRLRRATLFSENYNAPDKNHCFMIMFTSIDEVNLNKILKEYNLNPILIWEIILKQNYDKVVKIDDQTAFYNIEIIEENKIHQKFIIKVIHSFKRNLMFLFTTWTGQAPILHLMRKIFKFKNLEEVPKFKRKSIIFDFPPIIGLHMERVPSEKRSPMNEVKLSFNPNFNHRDNLLEVHKQNKSVHSDSDEDNSQSSKTDDSQASQYIGFPKKQETFGIKSKILQNKFKNAGFLNCEDILFGLIDESMRKIEPVIMRFEREAQALNNLSLNLSQHERLDYVRRSHLAKDVMMTFKSELKTKKLFLSKLKKQKFISNKFKLVIKFLEGRLLNCDMIMIKSQNLVTLCDQTYENMVDNKINEHSNNLNRIAQGLAAVTVIFLPCNLISGFMGMNVKVPFAEEDSEIPFIVIFGGTMLLAIFLYTCMKCLKVI